MGQTLYLTFQMPVSYTHLDVYKRQPLSGPIIQEKAREIAGKLNTGFSASNGWLDRFKQRHGIVYGKSVVNQSQLVTVM